MNRNKAQAKTAMAFGAAATMFAATTAVAQQQSWLSQFGTSEEDAVVAIASDGYGGVVVAGETEGDLGGRNAGGRDCFIARFDGAGNQLWIRQFGTDDEDEALAIASDGAGGVFVGGRTEGDLAGPNAGLDSIDAFLVHFDGAGDLLWKVQFGTNDDDWINGLASDGAGGVVVGGETHHELGGPYAGGFRDAFIARYDHEGNRIWTRQFGTEGADIINAVTSDGAGGVVVAGLTQGDLGGPNAGGMDSFIARFDGAGNQLWIRQFGWGTQDLASALSTDGAGGVMVAGWFGNITGGPNAGLEDAYLARYDGAGNRLWLRQLGTVERDQAWALAADGVGGALVAGTTRGNLAGPNPTPGQNDAFVARYDEFGDRLWARQFGTTTRDHAFAVVPTSQDGVVVAGFTVGSLGGANAGSSDAYLARYPIDSCYADCDQSTGGGLLDIFDFLCWQNDFVIGNSYACDCDMSTGPLVCNIFDFLCFQDAFIAGCP